MTDFPTLTAAVLFAREYAAKGPREYPFDTIYRTAFAQVDLVNATIKNDERLSSLTAGSVTVGIMAAKELGNDENDFAHALHVIQRYTDVAIA